jgi:hypothetical protein
VTPPGSRSAVRRAGKTLLLTVVVLVGAPVTALGIIALSLYALQLTADLVATLNR